MHFWIDKRSQICSLNTGRTRQFPLRCSQFHRNSSILGHKPYCDPMVTPVHRFQAIESVQERNDARISRASSNVRRNSSRLSHSRDRQQDRSPRNSRSQSVVDPSTALHPNRNGGQPQTELNDGTVFLVVPSPSGHQPNTTTYGFNVFNNIDRKFLCFVWVGIVITAAFFVPSQLLWDMRSETMGIIFTMMLIGLLCFSVTAFRMTKRATGQEITQSDEDFQMNGDVHQNLLQPTNPNTPSPRHSPLFRNGHPQSHGSPGLAVNNISRHVSSTYYTPGSTPGLYSPENHVYEEYDSWTRPISPCSDQASNPPPYDLAIMLPNPCQSDGERRDLAETPPPSYEKLLS